jgi:ketosteroid isomerase-like protein
VAEDAAASAELIERFYGAFARRDHETMGACYTPDARFSDPVFPDLRGDEVRAMWPMLCERGRDLELSHSGVRAEGDRGSARWEADYTLSATGRRVQNEIDAHFRFRDGLIAEWPPAPSPGAALRRAADRGQARRQRRGSVPSVSISSPTAPRWSR